MDLRNNRYPHGYRTWDDGLEATVLIGAFLTLVIVASALFYGAPWFSTMMTAGLDERPVAKAKIAVPPRSFPSTPPTFAVPTAVPQLAEQVIQPTPAPNLVVIPALSPTPVPSSPIPVSQDALVGRVANTGGDGVFLRHTPLLADRWLAWPDRTPLVFLGNEADGDGLHWIQVRDPKNNVGWVPAQYVARLGG